MLPLQENMDMNDPVEHVVWALVNMGGMMGAPIGVPVSVMRAWAKHLYDAGFRHNPDAQMIFFKPPATGTGVLHMGGEWVPADEPGVRPNVIDGGDTVVDAAIAGMSPDQKLALIEKLQGVPSDGIQ